MVTMEIDLDTLSTPELTFSWHAAGGNIDEMEVEIFDGTSWNLELTINRRITHFSLVQAILGKNRLWI